MDKSQNSKYLERFFVSCGEDLTKPVDGEIKGEVPKWIKGSLLRNGPGKFEFGSDSYKHYFDGASMMHKFQIKDGVVKYTNKVLQSEMYKKNMDANKTVVFQFGAKHYKDPCKSIFQRMMSIFKIEDMPDNANINLVRYGDGVYACTETPYMYRIDPETLDTKERIDVTKYTSVYSHTAHSHTLPDGTTLNFGLGFNLSGAVYKLTEFPPAKGNETFEKAKLISTIKSTWGMHPAYFHSFCITENYVVFVEQSVVVSLPSMAKMIYSQSSFKDCLEYHENREVIFHVVHRQSGKKIKRILVAPPFFFFHSVNSFEDSNCIVLDLCCYNDMELINSFTRHYYNPEEIFAHAKNYLKRFVLPLDKHLEKGENSIILEGVEYEAVLRNDGKVLCKPHNINLQGHSFELPTINYEGYNGKKYRYGYGVGGSYIDLDFTTKVIKIDLKTGEMKFWSEENLLPSEPIFVAHPDEKSEDHGVLLVSVLSLDLSLQNVVHLLILDAQSFVEIARVTFKTPSVIPKDIHGVFLK